MISLLFCSECGAANTTQATECFACHHPLDASMAEPSGQAHANANTNPTTMPPITPYNKSYVQPYIPQTSRTTGASSTSSGLRRGHKLMNRYIIQEEIGQGGFGCVYKARDENQANKMVAIKQINVDQLSMEEMIEVTDSYNREVILLSKLKHSNLPRVYDHFTDAKHWYIVMDYIKGETLEEHVQKTSGVLSLKKTLEIAIELCGILHYLHTRKPPIIFRDVKPANIMRKRNGRLYLIDFGIARRFTAGQVKDTGPLGSPGYAAPEQYGSRASTTTRTDIYGLAVTIQTLLTGEDPALLARGITAALPADTPPALQRLLAQMMEHDPDKRPRDILKVRRQLMLIKEGSVGLTVKYILSFIYGLFIGSLPYSPIILMTAILGLFHVPYYSLPSPLMMLTYLLLCTWPFAFITQIIIGCRRLFAGTTPYQRLIGAGICIMLVIVIVFKIHYGIFSGPFWFGGPLFPYP